MLQPSSTHTPVKKSDIQYSYLLRAVAILCVIADHCFTWFSNDTPDWRLFVYVFGGDSLLFFMVAGIHNLPVTNIRDFLVKKTAKFLFITAIFAIIYAFIDRYIVYRTEDRLATKLLTDLIFYPPKSWLWFMYAITGLYIASPFISLLVTNKSQRLTQFFIILWLMTGLVPFIETFYGRPLNSEYVLRPFAGYAGYMIAGWYLHRYPYRRWRKRSKIIIIATLVFLMLFPLLIQYTEYGQRCIAHDVFKNNLSITIMAVSITTFILAQQIKIQVNAIYKVIKFISSLTFPMYLVHGFAEYFAPFVKSHNFNIFAVTAITIAATISAAYILRFAFIALQNYLLKKLM